MRYSLLLTLLLLLATACSQPNARPLKPARVLPQLVEGSANVVLDEAVELSFVQLAGTPDAFTNQLVRATGTFVTLPPVSPCPDNSWPKGPQPIWGMVADELQMNAVGFEQVVPLVPEGEAFIVDGVWRKFIGPIGCGKEPASQVVYYLDVVQILQPNPITRNGTDSADGQITIPVDNTNVPAATDGEPSTDDSAEPPDELLPDESGGTEPEVQQPPPGGYPALVITPESPTSNAQPPATATRILIPPTPTASITPTPRSTDNDETVVQPTRTPLPTSVPRATSTPLPTETRTPLPTSVPRTTATSQADDVTATPTDEVDNEADETPTATPGVTDTPDPDATSTPTPTPTATPDPDVTPTATSGGVGSEVPTPGTTTPVPGGGATVTPDLTATASAGGSTPYPVPTSTPYPVPTQTPSR